MNQAPHHRAGATPPGSLAAAWAERLINEPLSEKPLAEQPTVDPKTIRLSRAERTVRDSVKAFVAKEQFEPPPLPAIAQEILAACASEDVAAAQLAEIAHRDSFIAGRVLKLANSAFVSGAVEAQTLRQAIVRIGQNELRNLVLAVVLKGRTFQFPEARDFAVMTWRHSLSCALAASLIASETGWAEPHRAFLAGLLHDVGKAVVLEAYMQMHRDRGDAAPSFDTAPAVAHAVHTDVGSLVADSWQLDDALREVLTLHHAPADAVIDEKLVSVVAYADALVAEVGLGEEPRLPDIVSHPIGLFMGYDEERLWDILDRVVQLTAQYDVD
jgi:HD-like signal output (HDOD) protein